MSGTHLHVHGIEEHIIEEEAEEGIGLAQWVAILSAIFACCAAMVGYQSANKENEALLLKNEAIITTTHAADTWALYQSKKMKAHMMMVAADLTPNPARMKMYQQEEERYEHDAVAIQKTAQEWEQKATDAETESKKLLKPHERLAQAMTLLQIAISLASITALTRKRWLLIVSLLSAVIGMGLVGLAVI